MKRKEDIKLDSSSTNLDIGTKSIEPLVEKLYWVQIAITVVIGISAFYLFEAGLISNVFLSDPIRELNARVFTVLGVHLIIIVAVSAITLRIKTERSIFECIKVPLKNLGTNVIILFLVFGLTYMLNIG